MARFSELPAGARIGVVAIIAVIVLVIVYFGLFHPIMKETQEFRTKTIRERSKIAEARERLSHLQEKKRLLRKMKEEAEVLMLKVPDKYNLPTLMEQFASTAQRASINQLPQSPLPSRTSTMPGSDLVFYVIPIEITNLQCRYKDFVKFLEGLGYLDRLVNIKWLKCRRLTRAEKSKSGGDDIPGIRVDMQLETYQLKSLGLAGSAPARSGRARRL